MLNDIKKIVSQKKEFLESANILFDEVNITGTTLFEESIIGEADEDAIGIETPTPAAPVPNNTPTPIAPVDDTETDDLLSVEVNARNGVVRDTLPVEPKGTETEDTDDDLMGSTLYNEPESNPDDEGNEGQEPTLESGENTSDDDLFNEAISMTDDGQKNDKKTDDEGKDDDDPKSNDDKGNGTSDDSNDDENLDDIMDSEIEGSDDDDDKSDDKGDNDVTSAVMDKVSEAEDNVVEPATDGDGENVDGKSSTTSATTLDNAGILDKLDDLQKNILNVKDEVKRQIN